MEMVFFVTSSNCICTCVLVIDDWWLDKCLVCLESVLLTPVNKEAYYLICCLKIDLAHIPGNLTDILNVLTEILLTEFGCVLITSIWCLKHLERGRRTAEEYGWSRCVEGFLERAIRGGVLARLAKWTPPL